LAVLHRQSSIGSLPEEWLQFKMRNAVVGVCHNHIQVACSKFNWKLIAEKHMVVGANSSMLTITLSGYLHYLDPEAESRAYSRTNQNQSKDLFSLFDLFPSTSSGTRFNLRFSLFDLFPSTSSGTRFNLRFSLFGLFGPFSPFSLRLSLRY